MLFWIIDTPFAFQALHYIKSGHQCREGMEEEFLKLFLLKRNLEMSSLQFRFFTPFPRSFYRLCGTRELSFFTNLVISTCFSLSLANRARTVLKALRASLQKQLGKAKPSDVALTFPKFLFILNVGSFSNRTSCCVKEDGWRGVTPATPAAEGVPHGGMGGVRT